MSRTRLNRLAKGAFVKVGSMIWMCGFMLIHMDCLVVAMDFMASMVVLQWVFCLIIHGDGCFWRLGFSLNEGFPGYILCHNFCGYVVYSLACGFIIEYLFQIYYGLCKNSYIVYCQVSLQVVSELWFYYCNPRLNPWECMRG